MTSVAFVFAIQPFCFMESFTGLAVADLILVRSMRVLTTLSVFLLTSNIVAVPVAEYQAKVEKMSHV